MWLGKMAETDVSPVNLKCKMNTGERNPEKQLPEGSGESC